MSQRSFFRRFPTAPFFKASTHVTTFSENLRTFIFHFHYITSIAGAPNEETLNTASKVFAVIL